MTLCTSLIFSGGTIVLLSLTGGGHFVLCNTVCSPYLEAKFVYLSNAYKIKLNSSCGSAEFLRLHRSSLIYLFRVILMHVLCTNHHRWNWHWYNSTESLTSLTIHFSSQSDKYSIKLSPLKVKFFRRKTQNSQEFLEIQQLLKTLKMS